MLPFWTPKQSMSLKPSDAGNPTGAIDDIKPAVAVEDAEAGAVKEKAEAEAAADSEARRRSS